jgi:uncharacterized protein YyaL (SSP411 family)
VLTAWNGLMIAAFARMARLLSGLGPPSPQGSSGEAGVVDAAAPYLHAAVRAAAFARERLWVPASRTLLRRYRDGHAEIDGYAEDYACLIFGLLELFQADANPAWLEWAVDLQRRQDELFWDEANGGWFGTTGRDPSVLLRMKEDYDGAEPTASSVSAMNLLVLSHLVDDPAWKERLERTFRSFGTRLEQMGRAVPMMAAALSAWTAGIEQVVIASPGASVDRDEARLVRAVADRYLPFAVTLTLTGERRAALAQAMPFVAAMEPIDGKATAYVCRHFACRQPVTTPEALAAELR